jgi:hypothetical protein
MSAASGLSARMRRVFEAYRDLIECVASNAYDAGERFDDQGRVLVTSEALGRAWARAR